MALPMPPGVVNCRVEPPFHVRYIEYEMRYVEH